MLLSIALSQRQWLIRKIYEEACFTIFGVEVLTFFGSSGTSRIAAWDWSKKWDLPINPVQCNYVKIGREVPLTWSFFPDRSGTPIPMSKLVKDLGVHTGNVFSPSAQCDKAVNKARQDGMDGNRFYLLQFANKWNLTHTTYQVSQVSSADQFPCFC